MNPFKRITMFHCSIDLALIAVINGTGKSSQQLADRYLKNPF